MAYNIYLAGLGSHGLSDTDKSSIKTSLQTWFNLIESGSVVSWVTAAPSIQEHELLCYFVTGTEDSIVKSLIGKAGTGNGITGWTSDTGSEVYVNKSRGFLAEMTFHELMHNKLHLDDADLHKKDGLAVAVVTAGMTPSTQNIADMKAKLNDKQKQWTSGFVVYNDPMRNL
jgi:hypothetical protein